MLKRFFIFFISKFDLILHYSNNTIYIYINMSKATDCIKKVAAATDKILLFHSATGKDSIAMLDLCAPFFKEIVCVFMYCVPNLQCVNRYIKWSESMYPNAHFIQCPHFNVSSYVKYGYLGCAVNPKQKLLNLADITEMARKKTGIEWAFFGMKEADSLQHRVFLRTYSMPCFQRNGVTITVDKQGEIVITYGDKVFVTKGKADATFRDLKDAVSSAELPDIFSNVKDDVPLVPQVLYKVGFTESDGIIWKTKKAYPLHLYKHKDIEKYIKDKQLITNVDYGEGMFAKATSSGESVDSPIFLNYLRNHFPSDLQKVYQYFPDAERILWEFDQAMAAAQNQNKNE